MGGILKIIFAACLVNSVLDISFGKKERREGTKQNLAKQDDNGVLHINEKNFNDTIKTFNLLILFVWKAKDSRSHHMDSVFTQLAQEMGLKANIYPFGKIAVGLETQQAFENS